MDLTIPYDTVICALRDYVYEEYYCKKYGQVFPDKGSLDPRFTPTLEEWIVNNCHAWVDTERTKWIFWNRLDYMTFLLKWLTINGDYKD